MRFANKIKLVKSAPRCVVFTSFSTYLSHEASNMIRLILSTQAGVNLPNLKLDFTGDQRKVRLTVESFYPNYQNTPVCCFLMQRQLPFYVSLTGINKSEESLRSVCLKEKGKVSIENH